MATNGPPCIDVTDYQFKLHQKSNVFVSTGSLRNNINLLATSSNYGLIFVGDPYKPEFQALKHQNIVDLSESGELLFIRNVKIPGIPNNIAVSCDGILLAVNYTLNNTDYVTIFNVPSFFKQNIETKFNIRVYPDDNASVKQILWNPVISNTFAVILDNGAAEIYNLKEDSSSYEFHSLNKNEQAKCGSWSPKGKQIVIGFPDGRLVQYKPDLKAAKKILCPPNVHDGPFDTIAVQWLSTFQFAVVFLQHGEEKTPSLYILNTPKNGPQTYINYSEICYSSAEGIQPKIFFNHIQQWNILLMASSTSVDVGILGTKDTSAEIPLWQQYITSDEARIELPLTDDKQETFPIGISLDLGSTHQLTIGETKISVMPMVHVLSSHGMLISYNFLNLTPTAVDICSPPNPIEDESHCFKAIYEILNDPHTSSLQQQQQQVNQQPNEISFSLPPAASTPTANRKDTFFSENIEPSKQLFENAPLSNLPFRSLNQGPTTITPKPLSFSGSGFFSNQQNLPQIQQQQQSQLGLNILNQNKPFMDTEKTKPLYTVPPIFNPTTVSQQQQQQTSLQPIQLQQEFSQFDDNNYFNKDKADDLEVNSIIKQWITTQTNAFEKELCEITKKNNDFSITPDLIEETRSYTKKLNQLLEDFASQKESALDADVRALRYSLHECFLMITESKSKLNTYNNPQKPQLATLSSAHQTNRRQLDKLKQLIVTNENQLNIINQLLNAEWSNYQDAVNKNSKNNKLMPNIEGIYQTLIREKDIVARQKAKLNYYKTKLGIKGLIEKKNDIDVNSLADAILSISLSEQVIKENSRLTENKLKKIRESLKNHKIIKIQPRRPDRVGLNSEVILETKAKTLKQREDVKTKQDKTTKERVKDELNKVIITKPTPTKATPSSNPILNIQSISQHTQNNAQQKSVISVPQQTKEIQLPSIGSSFTKPGETIVQPVQQQSSGKLNLFSGLNFSQPQQQTSLFSGTNKTLDLSKLSHEPLMFATPQFGKTATYSLLTPIEKEKANATIKEQAMPISFVPKVLDSDQAFSSGGFTTIQQDENKPIAEISAQKTTPETKINTYKPILSTINPNANQQPALFSANFGSITSAENKQQTSTTGFGLLTLKDSTANQESISQATSSFGSFTLTPKMSNVTLKVAQEIPPIPSSTSTSSESLTFTTTASETLAFSTTSKNDSNNTFSNLQTPPVQTPTTETGFNVNSTGSTTGNSGITSFSFATLGNLENLTMKPETTTATPVTKTESQVTDLLTKTNNTTDNEANILDNLNICKPTSSENLSTTQSSGTNLFSGGLSDVKVSVTSTTTESKQLFGATTTPTTGINFGNVASSGTLFANVISSPTTTFSETISSGSLFGATTTTSSSTSFTTPLFSNVSGQTPASFGSTGSAISSFSFVSSPQTTATGFSSPLSSASNTIFGGSSIQTTPSTLFGGATTITPISSFTTPTAASSTDNLFGRVPKPTQSSFSTVNFGQLTVTPVSKQTNSPSIFGGTATFGQLGDTKQTTSASSIFGGSTSGFGMQSNASGNSTGFGATTVSQSNLFGQAANTSTSIFGAPKSETSTNLFGTASQTNPGSLFGPSSFSNTSQNTGSIFGGSGISGFGSAFAPSPFGSSGNTQTSPFSSGNSTFPQQNTFGTSASTFGSTSNTGGGFVSPTSSSGGIFAQGGSSVAQTGFGSPTNLSKSTFGGSPTFGGAPTFGSAPTFGGAPAFGSPKSGFGTFASNAPNASFTSPPTQKNNLFESLGSSDNTLSFGNLAQNTAAQNAAKNQFGGSSFSSWR